MQATELEVKTPQETVQSYDFEALYNSVFPDFSGFPGRQRNNPAPTVEQVLGKLSELSQKARFARDSSRSFLYLRNAGLIANLPRVNNVNTKHGRYAKTWFTLTAQAIQFYIDLERKAHSLPVLPDAPVSMVERESVRIYAPSRDHALHVADCDDYAEALAEMDDDRRAERSAQRYAGVL